jgi:methylmalonyl-CoA mutase
MNFYLEIAKMRAARLLWAPHHDRVQPQEPKSMMLRTHSQTSGWSLTEQDPYNNVVRTTIEAMAAVFGGTQSLHTNALDEAIALPTEFSARIARNTQMIIQEETGIIRVVDPWAGSYMMEKLTQDMADKAWALIEEVEAAGGMAKAIESGWAKMRIEECAAEEAGAHRLGQGCHRRRQQVQAGQGRRQRSRCSTSTTTPCASRRSPASTRSAPPATPPRCRPRSTALTKCAETGEGNLLDLSVKAMRLRATVGEISDALEKVFGRYRANRKPFPASMEPSWKNRKTGRPSRPTSRPSSPKKAAARA